ncbi:MAG TPA: hypothetical protein VE954_20565 [Oligoflexus sp.]|nr:hypothetical protein [Oligoflexus sp.]HYX35496.1 hypothetical protein [Oligoflexus sp.]
MAQVGRLVGAIIAVSGEDIYLVGDCKEPCDFHRYGLENPAERNVLEQPYIKLQKRGAFQIEGQKLHIALEGEALPQLLVDTFLIFRNGSVSERLWRLCLQYSPEPIDGLIDADWLRHTPRGVWEIVRDTILRCS